MMIQPLLKRKKELRQKHGNSGNKQRQNIISILSQLPKQDLEKHHVINIETEEQKILSAIDNFSSRPSILFNDILHLMEAARAALSFWLNRNYIFLEIDLSNFLKKQVRIDGNPESYFYLHAYDYPVSLEEISFEKIKLVRECEREAFAFQNIKKEHQEDDNRSAQEKDENMRELRQKLIKWAEWINFRSMLSILEEIIGENKIGHIQSSDFKYSIIIKREQIKLIQSRKKFNYLLKSSGALKLVRQYLAIDYTQFNRNCYQRLIGQLQYFYQNKSYSILFRYLQHKDLEFGYQESCDSTILMTMRDNKDFMEHELAKEQSKVTYMIVSMLQLMSDQTNQIQDYNKMTNLHYQFNQALHRIKEKSQKSQFHGNCEQAKKQISGLCQMLDHMESMKIVKALNQNRQKISKLIQQNIIQVEYDPIFMGRIKFYEHIIWNDQQHSLMHNQQGLCIFHNLHAFGPIPATQTNTALKIAIAYENYSPLSRYLCQLCIYNPKWRNHNLFCVVHKKEITHKKRLDDRVKYLCNSCLEGVEDENILCCSQHKQKSEYICLNLQCKFNKTPFCSQCLFTHHFSHRKEVFNTSRTDLTDIIMTNVSVQSQSQQIIDQVKQSLSYLYCQGLLQKIFEDHTGKVVNFQKQLSNIISCLEDKESVSNKIKNILTFINRGQQDQDILSQYLSQIQNIFNFNRHEWVKETKAMAGVAQYIRDSLQTFTEAAMVQIVHSLEELRRKGKSLIEDKEIVEKAEQYLDKKYQTIFEIQQENVINYFPCSILKVQNRNKGRVKRVIINKKSEEKEELLRGKEEQLIRAKNWKSFYQSDKNKGRQMCSQSLRYVKDGDSRQNVQKIISQFCSNIEGNRVRLKQIKNKAEELKLPDSIKQLNTQWEDSVQKTTKYIVFCQQKFKIIKDLRLLSLKKDFLIQYRNIIKEDIFKTSILNSIDKESMERLTSNYYLQKYMIIIRILKQFESYIKSYKRILNGFKLILQKQQVIEDHTEWQRYKIRVKIISDSQSLLRIIGKTDRQYYLQKIEEIEHSTKQIIKKQCKSLLTEDINKEWTNALISFPTLTDLQISYLKFNAAEDYFSFETFGKAFGNQQYVPYAKQERKNENELKEGATAIVEDRISRMGRLNIGFFDKKIQKGINQELLHMRSQLQDNNYYQDYEQFVWKRQIYIKLLKRHCQITSRIKINKTKVSFESKLKLIKNVKKGCFLQLCLQKITAEQVITCLQASSHCVVTLIAIIGDEKKPLLFNEDQRHQLEQWLQEQTYLLHFTIQYCSGLDYQQLINNLNQKIKTTNLSIAKPAELHLNYSRFTKITRILLCNIILLQISLPKDHNLTTFRLQNIIMSPVVKQLIFKQLEIEIIGQLIYLFENDALELSFYGNEITAFYYDGHEISSVFLRAISGKWPNILQMKLKDKLLCMSSIEKAIISQFPSLILLDAELNSLLLAISPALRTYRENGLLKQYND